MHQAIAFGQRRAGVLLHVSSLPNATLGDSAFHFVDFLADSGFTVWQVLPLLPPDSSGSPYQPLSLFAGNPEFIDIEALGRDLGLPTLDSRRAAFRQAGRQIERLSAMDNDLDFGAFRWTNRSWLEPYTVFAALRDRYGAAPWTSWPSHHRDAGAEQWPNIAANLATEVRVHEVAQFLFHRQWCKLKQYANAKGIYLLGDLPFYAAQDSADVWASREMFHLTPNGHPALLGGAPPDGFSDQGQRWGCPVFDWTRMQRDGFAWWLRRLKHQMELFDILRIDHFRGLESYWAIPAEAPDARSGQWIDGPRDALLGRMRQAIGDSALIAEDLGTITDAVTRLRRGFGLPGMRVLQFAFDGVSDNPHLPANHSADTVIYTGTHDNDTTLGWWNSVDDAIRGRVLSQLPPTHSPMPWPVVEMALDSIGQVAILPMQDLLALGSEARLNYPGTVSSTNWQWRIPTGTNLPTLARQLAPMLIASSRSG